MSLTFVRDPENGSVLTYPRNPMAATGNYLVGQDPRHWKTGLPLFSEIAYTGIWRGVELTYVASEDHLKAEYHASPGADVKRILLRFDGETQIAPDGSLRIHAATGDFVEEKPILYQ